MSAERVRERYAAALVRVDERIAELDAEILQESVPVIHEAAKVHLRFTGAERRRLADRVLERLCLVAVREAHDLALGEAVHEQSQRDEYDARVEAPKREAEAQQQARKVAEAEHIKLVADALWRVKSTKGRVAKPDDADIELLRKNTWYRGRAHAPEDIGALIRQYDDNPWWQTATKKTG